MPAEERERRSRALRQTVMNNTIDDWVAAQMKDIRVYRERTG
jgi:trehalose 6-phosphate synthase